MRTESPPPSARRIFFVSVLVVSFMLPAAAYAARSGAPIEVAFQEQSIGAADLTPTPTATPTPNAEGVMPPTPSPTPSATPTEQPIFAEPTAMPTPTGEPSPPDIGSITPTLRVSDSSLESIIGSESDPARAASLRVTDEARKELLAGQTDDAIRTLSRAIGIDSANPYAYLYLGRAYIAKKDLTQALSFFKRAEIGFGTTNPVWLGETLAFEGLAYEQADHINAAAAAYQQAMAADPGNLMARVGYTRLAPSVTSPPGVSPSAMATENANLAPPQQSEAPPPPTVAPPPPPPGESDAPND